MDDFWVTILRTVIGFSFMLLLTRLLGKKQLGQMTFFTYITGITFGNVAASVMIHLDIALYNGIASLTLWTILTFIVEYISLKSNKARVLLDDEPTILIKKGVIQKHQLARLRLNMDDLSMLLRNHNIFSIKDVDYAIFEPNGQLSVLKKSEKELVVKADLQLPVDTRKSIPTVLIVDGKIIERNLKELNITKEWLVHHLHALGYKSPKEIFFAEMQTDDGTLYVAETTEGEQR